MKPITSEWIAKAEGDFAMMERECLVTENPNYDGICFHAQQCAENISKHVFAKQTSLSVKSMIWSLFSIRLLIPSMNGRVSGKTLRIFRTLQLLFVTRVNQPIPSRPLTLSRGVGDFARRLDIHLD